MTTTESGENPAGDPATATGTAPSAAWRLAARRALDPDRPGFPLLLGAGVTAAGVVVAWIMQYVKNAPFPPTISISAYGLPPNGWLLTLSATLIGLGSIPLAVRMWDGPTKAPRAVPVLLVIWTIGMITLGWVHTNQPHTPAGPSTLVHQSAAVIAMLVFPVAIGILALQRIRRGVASPMDSLVIFTMTAASVVCLVLLFFAAFGVDTAGIGAHRSWALYQFAAAVIDIVTVWIVSLTIYRDHRRLARVKA